MNLLWKIVYSILFLLIVIVFYIISQWIGNRKMNWIWLFEIYQYINLSKEYQDYFNYYYWSDILVSLQAAYGIGINLIIVSSGISIRGTSERSL